MYYFILNIQKCFKRKQFFSADINLIFIFSHLVSLKISVFIYLYIYLCFYRFVFILIYLS